MSLQFKSPEVGSYFRFVFSRWKLIIGISFAASVVAAGLTLGMDNEYKSTANLFPAAQRSLGIEALLGGRIGSLAGSLIGGGSKTVFDRYYVILQSESVRMNVIETFDLVNIYENQDEKWPILATMADLADNTQFRGSLEGNFLIEVWDKDPERAKAMADHFVMLLNQKSLQIATTEAGEYRTFIEGRYNQGLVEIDSLRQRTSEFQRQYGVFELTEQTREYFRAVGQLYTQQFELEAQYVFLNRTLDSSNPQVQQAKLQLDLMDQKIEQVLRSDDPNKVLLNLDTLPEIASQYYELMLSIEIQTELMKFLVPIYEQAKLEEVKQIPIVTVIDAPSVPYKKDRPFRAVITLGAGLSTFILLLLFFVARHTYLANRPVIINLFREEHA